jgi:hypothetical protein
MHHYPISALGSRPALGPSPKPVKAAPRAVEKDILLTVTATVAAIDQAKREVTLKATGQCRHLRLDERQAIE